MKLHEVQVDVNYESDGQWRELPEFPGVSVKVRGLAYRHYTDALATMRTDMAQASRDKQDRHHASLLAQHILMDIAGLEDDNDQPIKYDTKLGSQIFRDPQFRSLSNAIVRQARLVSQEAETRNQEDAGN